MRIRVTFIDDGLTAPELDAAVPFEAELIRRLPGPDRPDYWLAALDRPISWGDQVVSHLIVAPAWEDRDLSPRATGVPLNIAYVTDWSLLTDDALSFDKAVPIALGTADVLRGVKPRARRRT